MSNQQKITELTEAQKAKFPYYRELYTQKLFGNNPPAKFEEVEEYMHWFYKEFDVSPNKKPTVILMDSPHLLKKATHIFKLLEDKKFDNEMAKFIKSEIYKEDGRVDEKSLVRLLEMDNIKELLVNIESPEPCYYLSGFNSWIAFYDFFDKECQPFSKTELFNKFKKILDLNIFWSIAYEDFVFVARNATAYHRDGENRLHNAFGPAVQFLNDDRLYFIHGVSISREMYEKLEADKYTFEEFTREDNEEVKAAALSFLEERFGGERVFRFISEYLTEKDTYKDDKYQNPEFLEGTTKSTTIGVYTFFKGRVGDIDLAYVRCYCPSTDRMFFLSVHPENTNAKDAIASLYRCPRLLVDHIQYINRQGERYSTIFNEKGTELMHKMTKEQAEDLVSISGDKYFSLMRYEY